MPQFIWKDEYSVGVDEIDFQHKKFFDLANALYEKLNAEGEKQAKIFALADLSGYADKHFSTEEEYFKTIQFEGMKEHVKHHDFYRQKLAEFMEKLRINDTNVGEEIKTFLEEWINDHMLHVGDEYSIFAQWRESSNK